MDAKRGAAIVVAVIALTACAQATELASENRSFIEQPAPPATSTPSTTTTVVADLGWMNTTTTTAAVVAVERPTTTSTVFFECVRWRESRGDYTVSDPTNTFHGAYQIYQGGWDSVASSIGRHDLVGVRPDMAAPAEQDTIAAAMYEQYGARPWGGACQ